MSDRVLSDAVEVVDGASRCRRCGHGLGPAGRNYKLGALVLELRNPRSRSAGVRVASSGKSISQRMGFMARASLAHNRAGHN